MIRVVREKTISWTESSMQVWSSSSGRDVGDAISSRCDLVAGRCEICSVIALNKTTLTGKDNRKSAQIQTTSVNTAVDLDQVRSLLCRTKREAKKDSAAIAKP